MKKVKPTDVLRKWGIYNHSGFNWLRYRNPPEKGIYWYYFSKWVRQRDVEKWGTCISCDRPITIDTCDAGHFAPASNCGRDLLFDPMNVNAECGRCNAFDDGHLIGYERGLIKRYGQSAVDDLKQRYLDYRDNGAVVKDWKADEYADKIRALPNYQQRDDVDVVL